jgi:hypothetical protein
MKRQDIAASAAEMMITIVLRASTITADEITAKKTLK